MEMDINRIVNYVIMIMEKYGGCDKIMVKNLEKKIRNVVNG